MDSMSFFVILIVVSLPIFVMYFVGIGTGHITIEKYYYDDLQQCELDLENIQPFCPACECKSNIGLNIVLLIMGIIIGLLFQELWIKYQNEKRKKVKKK